MWCQREGRQFAVNQSGAGGKPASGKAAAWDVI